MRKNVSSYRIFAVTDIIIGIGALLYAIYDIIAAADSAFFPGLAGWLLLLFVIPSVLFLLLMDYMIYWKRKNKS